MKRFFAIIALSMGVSVSALAQARFTSSTQLQHLGQIEWKRPVTVQYTVTNTGNEPLVLTEVEPDCACTAARWTKTPIAPGHKGTVDVTFDAEALGHFQKSVAIFTNASPHLVYLKFDGEVVTEITDFARTHPYQVGQIRIDQNEINFPDVQRGERPVAYLSVVNLSDTPYEPVLMHLPPYLEMKAEPEVLQQGERGTLTLTLNSEKLTDLGLTQSSVYLSRFLGDKVSEENELPVSAILLPDFSGLTENERLNAPVIRLSAEDIDRIINAYIERKDIDKFCHVADMQEIESNDYNLNIPRYVDTFEEEPEIDIKAVMAEIKDLESQRASLDEEINKYLKELGILED